MKQSVKDRECAIRNAEEGAADLKKRAEELSQNLNEYETQYQVKSVSICLLYLIRQRYLLCLYGVQIIFCNHYDCQFIQNMFRV